MYIMQLEDTHVKQKVVKCQIVETITNIYKFMKWEAEHGQPINVRYIPVCAIEATGIWSLRLQYFKGRMRNTAEFLTSQKKRLQKPKIWGSVTSVSVLLGKTVSDFHLRQKEQAAMKSLVYILRNKTDFIKSFQSFEFQWRKFINNQSYWQEKIEIHEMSEIF